VETYPDDHGVVRSVLVRINGHDVRRPIHKLYLIQPAQENSPSDLEPVQMASEDPSSISVEEPCATAHEESWTNANEEPGTNECEESCTNACGTRVRIRARNRVRLRSRNRVQMPARNRVPEVGPDLDNRTRLRQNCAFFFRTRIRSQKSGKTGPGVTYLFQQ